MRRTLAILVVLLAAVPPMSPQPVKAQGQCLSRREARQVIRSGVVVRPGRLTRRLGGKVLRLDLCQGGGGLVWVVTLLRGDGRVVDVVVDAQSGGR